MAANTVPVIAKIIRQRWVRAIFVTRKMICESNAMAFRWTRADSGTSPNDSGSSTVGMFVFKRYAQVTRESPFEEIARCIVEINQLLK